MLARIWRVAVAAALVAACVSIPPPEPLAAPSPAPSPVITPAPAPDPTPTQIPEPSPSPTPTPSPTSTPAPTRTPTPTPTPTPESRRLRLMAVGDVNLALHVGERIRSVGPQLVFDRVAGFLAAADVAVANLECSLSDAGTPWPGKEEHFAAPPRAVEALLAGGFDVVTLGNNHILDFNREGLLETLAILDANDIEHAGAGTDQVAARAPVIVEANGLSVALLSYVVPFSAKQGFNTKSWVAREDLPGVALARRLQLRDDVLAARAVADVVVVFLHNGGEFRRMPKRSQVGLADVATAAGAALVVGHGPHNLQGYVRRGKTLIAYSLGNFVFDEYTGRQNDSAILDVTLSPQGVESVTWIPVVIEDGLPRPATAVERERIMSQLAHVPANDDA